MLFRQPDPALEVTPDNERGCASTFLAARESAASNRDHDINGIFGASCRHGCLIDFFGTSSLNLDVTVHSFTHRAPDIKKGEKYVYANTALSLQRSRVPHAKVILFYDIACKIKPHLKVSYWVYCCVWGPDKLLRSPTESPFGAPSLAFCGAGNALLCSRV